jgi:hypothetical protein
MLPSGHSRSTLYVSPLAYGPQKVVLHVKYENEDQVKFPVKRSQPLSRVIKSAAERVDQKKLLFGWQKVELTSHDLLLTPDQLEIKNEFVKSGDPTPWCHVP